MKLEISAYTYDTIISELSGISFLLACIADATQDKYADEGLHIIRRVVIENADKLNQVLDQQEQAIDII